MDCSLRNRSRAKGSLCVALVGLGCALAALILDLPLFLFGLPIAAVFSLGLAFVGWIDRLSNGSEKRGGHFLGWTVVILIVGFLVAALLPAT